MTALATLASAVLFAQILDREGMLAAAMRSESHGLNLPDLSAARDAAIRPHPKAAPHAALARLFRLLTQVDEGTRDTVEAEAEARQEMAADPDNLVTRLAGATVLDLASAENAGQSGSTTAPAVRFDAFRAIVDSEPPARRATLYNAELTATWHDVVKRFMKRPDVAASFAAAWPHYAITNQYAALPVIQRRLSELSAELRKAGHIEAAERCTRWIARLMLALIDADPDAGTRLLCADLLARSLDPQSPAACSLRRFQDDFTAVAEAAPIDVCDQAWSPTPAVVPSAYKWAFYSLVFACGLAMIAMGGAVLFAVSCVAALVVAIVLRGQPDAIGVRRPPVYVRLASAALPPFAITAVCVAYLNGYGMYSQTWALVTGLCAFAVGTLLAVALANLNAASDQSAVRRRVMIVILLASLGVLLAIAPPPVVTRACRALDVTIGTRWILLPGLAALIVAAIAVGPARFRAIASAAAMVWCLNACIAVAVLQFHRSADSRYQQAVVAARLDEVPARLGPDWQKKYLKAAQDAYDINKP
jgi:hypothetical protein